MPRPDRAIAPAESGKERSQAGRARSRRHQLPTDRHGRQRKRQGQDAEEGADLNKGDEQLEHPAPLRPADIDQRQGRE